MKERAEIFNLICMEMQRCSMKSFFYLWKFFNFSRSHSFPVFVLYFTPVLPRAPAYVTPFPEL